MVPALLTGELEKLRFADGTQRKRPRRMIKRQCDLPALVQDSGNKSIGSDGVCPVVRHVEQSPRGTEAQITGKSLKILSLDGCTASLRRMNTKDNLRAS